VCMTKRHTRIFDRRISGESGRRIVCVSYIAMEIDTHSKVFVSSVDIHYHF